MSDLEITRLCAEAMGYSVVKGDKRFRNQMQIATADGEPITCWRPLEDDAQAMALVKKFFLGVDPMASRELGWCVTYYGEDDEQPYEGIQVKIPDLNRAICECVAKMQAALSPGASISNKSSKTT